MNKEEHLQIQVAEYLRYQHPDVLWCHIANERKTSARRGAKLKKVGVRAGMPDIMIFTPMTRQRKIGVRTIEEKTFTGLAIELKVKPNKPTENQKKVMQQLEDNGWIGDFCYTFEEAKGLIDRYLR